MYIDVDYDGVLGDFWDYIASEIQKKHRKDPVYKVFSVADVETYDLTNLRRDIVNDIWGLFKFEDTIKNFKYYDYTDELLQYLYAFSKEIGYTLRIHTLVFSLEAFEIRYSQILGLVERLGLKDCVIQVDINEKLVNTDVYMNIEDSFDNLKAGRAQHKVLLNKPYNRQYVGAELAKEYGITFVDPERLLEVVKGTIKQDKVKRLSASGVRVE